MFWGGGDVGVISSTNINPPGSLVEGRDEATEMIGRKFLICQITRKRGVAVGPPVKVGHGSLARVGYSPRRVVPRERGQVHRPGKSWTHSNKTTIRTICEVQGQHFLSMGLQYIMIKI